MRRRVFVAKGTNTTFYGSGRKEFNPKKMPPFESYLLEAAHGSLADIDREVIDEGVMGSFMSGRFIHQANLPGFLPWLVPELKFRPCFAVEGACGTGGRAIGTACRAVLSEIADVVFVIGFEMQNQVKAVYGADILAGAGYYHKERKRGEAHYFPGVFAKRAGAYFETFDAKIARQGMAKWYEQMILNARKNPKAQEYHNETEDLISLAMTPPNPKRFLPYLNNYDCSKVSDGASSLLVFSEEGMKKLGLKKEEVVEIIAMGEAEADITEDPSDLIELQTMRIAATKAFLQANLSCKDLSLLELHDCFTITALLGLEALGFCEQGQGARFVLEGKTAVTGEIPTNLSGGLGGFGHPTGATGVRQMVDLLLQLTGKAENQAKLNSPYGMMVSMGGNDVTLSAFIAKKLI